MLSDGFESVHLTFVQRFEFPHPVLLPEKFREIGILRKEKEYEFLLDPVCANEEIDSMEKKNFGEIGIIKPIRNIESQKDTFWRYFIYEEHKSKPTQDMELPYYPFQIIPRELNLKENRNKIEEIMDMKIIDSKMNAQVRLFPCGIGTVHLYLYLKPKELDADRLLRLTSDPTNIRILCEDSQGKQEKHAFEFFNYLVNKTMDHMFDKNLTRTIYGYFLLFNFQGKGFEALSKDDIEDFSRILRNKWYATKRKRDSPKKKQYRRIIERDNLDRTENGLDYIFISPKTAILFIDEGIRDIGHLRILKGRRCFRSHFLNILEMAYNSEWFFEYYNSHFKWILEEIKAEKVGKSLLDYIKKVSNPNVFPERLYKTIERSLLSIPKKLSLRDEFFSNIFWYAADVMNLGPLAAQMNTNLDRVYEEALKRNIQLDFLKGIYGEVKWWVSTLLPSIPDLLGSSAKKGEKKSV